MSQEPSDSFECLGMSDIGVSALNELLYYNHFMLPLVIALIVVSMLVFH